VVRQRLVRADLIVQVLTHERKRKISTWTHLLTIFVQFTLGTYITIFCHIYFVSSGTVWSSSEIIQWLRLPLRRHRHFLAFCCHIELFYSLFYLHACVLRAVPCGLYTVFSVQYTLHSCDTRISVNIRRLWCQTKPCTFSSSFNIFDRHRMLS